MHLNSWHVYPCDCNTECTETKLWLAVSVPASEQNTAHKMLTAKLHLFSDKTSQLLTLSEMLLYLQER